MMVNNYFHALLNLVNSVERHQLVFLLQVAPATTLEQPLEFKQNPAM